MLLMLPLEVSRLGLRTPALSGYSTERKVKRMKIFNHAPMAAGAVAAALLAPLMLTTALPAQAQAPAPARAAAAAPAALSVELNKAEPYKAGCRIFLVIRNDIAARIDNAQMDMVVFNKDNILAERFVVDLGRIRKAKTIIAPIDIDGTKCDDMGHLLINDMPNCKTDSGDVDCVERLDVSSRHRIQLKK